MRISICRRSLALAFLTLLAWTPLASTVFGQESGSAFPPGRWVPANEDVIAALYHKLLPPQPEERLQILELHLPTDHGVSVDFMETIALRCRA